MTLSTNINSYADVASVLSQAFASGQPSVRYILPNKGMATKWVARAYNYRKLLMQQLRLASGNKGFQPPTPYDNMILRRKDNIIEIVPYRQPEGQLEIGGELQSVTLNAQPATLPLPIGDEGMDRAIAQALDLASLKGV